MEASITVRLIDETQRGFSNINRNLTSIGATARNLNNTMNGLAGAASAFASALAVREVLTFVDRLQAMDNRLKLVTTSQNQLNQTFEDLFQVAQRTRAPLSESIDLYSKLALAQDTIGKSGSDLTKIIEAFNMSLAISGTTGAGASAAILQFAQAMQSGRLNGDEFRTMLEQAPRFLKALSDATGIAQGKLKEFASKGLLDSKIVAQALIDELPNLQREFGKTTTTVGQATTQLSNSFQKMVRDFDSASGASDLMVRAIKLLENNLGAVTIALGLFATALAIGSLIQVVTFAVAGLTTGIKALTAAVMVLVRTPMGRLISILGAAGIAMGLFSDEAEAADFATNAMSDTQKDLTNEITKGQGPTQEMQGLMDKLGVSTTQTKDAYQDFIVSLKQEIELSKLDSKEKTIQQAVYKALAAEAKQYGGDLSKISETRRKEIEQEVRALATQVEDEKAKTEQRKKIQDDLIRKQEEYDRFIKDSRTANMTDLEKFIDAQNQIETDYRNGALRDEQQYQDAKAALQAQYQKKYTDMLDEFYESTLDDTAKFQREAKEITEAYQAGLIKSEEDYQMLLKGIRSKYGKEFDDMAKKQREEEMTATEKHQSELEKLDRAWRGGLIKNQEDYDAIRRKIDKEYIDQTVSDYNNLYGLLNEKLLEWSGLTQKEYGIVKDVIKLTFGVDVEDLIKEFFAASIRYVLGFRTASEKDMGVIGSTINKLFGSGGSASKDVGIFKTEGTGILEGFGSAASSIFNGLTSIISKVFSGGLDIVASFVKGALDLLGGLGGAFGDILGSIGGGIGDLIGGVGDIFSGDIFGSIGDIFSGDIFGSIGDIFSGGDIFGSIGDVLGSLGSGVMDVVSSIGDITGISDILGSLGSAFGGSGTASAVGSALSVAGGAAATFLAPAAAIYGFFDLFGATDMLGHFNVDDRDTYQMNKDAKRASDNLKVLDQKSRERTEFFKSDEGKAYSFYQGAQERMKQSPIMAYPADYAILGLPYTQKYLDANRFYPGPLPSLNDFMRGWNIVKPVLGDPPASFKGIYYMAKGGILNRPTMFGINNGVAIAGEAGAEAVLPLKRGGNGELGVNVEGMQSVNVNFTINAVDARDLDRVLVERKQFITNMVRSAMAGQGRSMA